MRNHDPLLRQRIGDLPVSLRTPFLQNRIRRLYSELRARGLRFRPVCYLADEWFVPEGEPVIGIPFYLASKPLRDLERCLTGAVEGERSEEAMRLLRHEAGHAITYAFGLNRSKAYRAFFGPSSRPFSEHYAFDPESRYFVINLPDHYAQSHPDEDFAETFAVWLGQSERLWRRDYRFWPALRKLEYVDALMKRLRGKAPRRRRGRRLCEARSLRLTLAAYYRRRLSARERDHRE